MNVFTYGSLMYPAVWERVVRGRYAGAPAVLEGYRRLALHGVDYPGAVPQPGARIEGRVYLEVGPDDLARLDAFEADDYRREEVWVHPEGGAPVRAQVYVFVTAAKLAGVDWDAARFEREHLARFVAAHAAAGAFRG